MIRKYAAIALSALLWAGCAETPAPAPVLPVPSEQQVAWQQMETYAFIHFGPNTFLDQEWGYGDADPAVFNPARLDCRQWVRTLKQAGMKGIIFTAKHHDGFCLWPSRHTDYSVAASPWKGGKGDVVMEFSEACRKEGMKMGLYLSPWDRHQASYGTEEYVHWYHRQLREIMSNYGPCFEIWFDGANGGDGWYGGAEGRREIDRKHYYNYPEIYQILDELQPGIIVFSDGGPGCRWVGNEKGYADATNWSFLREGEVYPGYPHYRELSTGHPDGNQWTAAECDVSIRPGWFYHEAEDSLVKPVDHLLDLYYRSVGHNATLLLNVPVNRDGLISRVDSLRLLEWRQALEEDFRENLLAGARVKASDSRGRTYAARRAADGDPETCWATSDGVTEAVLEFGFREETALNRLVLQEYIPLGQRVAAFQVDYLEDGQWRELAVPEETTTIGYKRILRFERVNTKGLRIRFLDSRGPLVISEVAAFNAPDR